MPPRLRNPLGLTSHRCPFVKLPVSNHGFKHPNRIIRPSRLLIENTQSISCTLPWIHIHKSLKDANG